MHRPAAAAGVGHIRYSIILTTSTSRRVMPSQYLSKKSLAGISRITSPATAEIYGDSSMAQALYL